MNTFANKYSPVLWPDLVVIGAGSVEVNGQYSINGYRNGRPNWTGNGPGNANCNVFYDTVQWVIEDGVTGASYIGSGASTYPYGDTYSVDAGKSPAPVVGPTSTVVPQGLLTLSLAYQTLSDLGLSPKELGGANAIMLGPTPLAMLTAGTTVFQYTYNGSGFGSTFGYCHAPLDNGTNKFQTPLLVEGRAAMDLLALCALTGDQQVYYQLLQGNV